MAVAQGSCPGCGAPIEFSVGSSVSAVCKYCNTTVRRTDRGLENLGKVAELADTPSIVAVGDTGSLGGQSFVVLGKVQLLHDLGGVWDEWYLGFSNGRWGWLAYAQGLFYATWKVDPAPSLPQMRDLRIESPVNLGQAGTFRVVELKQATIASAEGELPFAPRTGQPRYYADLSGQRSGFATIDWGQGNETPELFVGYQLLESQLQITQQAERPQRQVNLEGLNCPGCGAPLRLVAGARIERVACKHCGTVSESASQKIIARQDAARAQPAIPLGASGSIDQVQYTVIGFVLRSSSLEGEHFTWSEYLLFSPGLGFRWLVDDDGTWRMASALNVADLELSRMPNYVGYNGRSFSLRNSNVARVEYVLGEFYWKVQVGESVQVMDFESGPDIISREAMNNEVNWSASPVIPWGKIATAFGLSQQPPFSYASDDDDEGPIRHGAQTQKTTVIILVVVIIIVIVFFGMCCGLCPSGGSTGSYSTGGGVRGGGTPVFGGGWSGGK